MALKTWLLAIAACSAFSSASAKTPKTAAEIQLAAEKALETLERKAHRSWDDSEAETIRSSATAILAAKLTSDQAPNEQQLADGKTLQNFVTEMSLVCSTHKPVGTHFSQRICQTRRAVDAQANAGQSRLRDMQSKSIQQRAD
jgi:nicotinamide mononucleotide adenylyltransferase